MNVWTESYQPGLYIVKIYIAFAKVTRRDKSPGGHYLPLVLFEACVTLGDVP